MTATAAAGRQQRHFERTSLYLVVNTALTGGLGMLFWLLAARLYPDEEVGATVAAASLLVALAFASQLNLPTALSRFFPTGGDGRRWMVVFSYRIALAVSTAVGLALVAVTALRGGELYDGGRMPLILALAFSLPVWTIFAMQDAVLIAARRSGIVPVENGVSTVAKFALLPLGTGLAAGSGLLLAWTIPTAVAIVVVSWLVFARIVPRLPDDLSAGTSPLPSARRFLGYALADFPGAVLYLLSLRLVPLLLVVNGGALDGAYLGLPWTIITVAALALPQLSRSLLVELSHDDVDTRALLQRANHLIVRLIVPAALVVAVLAHPVLAVAGARYARVGAPVLAWGVIGLIPASIVECQLAVLRYRGAVVTATIVQAVRAVALLAGVIVVVELGSPSGIGAVLAAVNLVMAAVGWVVARDARANLGAEETPAAAVVG